MLLNEFLTNPQERDYYMGELLASNSTLAYLYTKYANRTYESYPLVLEASDIELFTDPRWYIFLCMCLERDSACVERTEFIKVVRFYEPRYLPEIGDMEMRSGNYDTTLGEGLYCYKIGDTRAHESLPTRPAVILEGLARYWECIYYNDDSENRKYGEILILKDTPLLVVDICNSQEELTQALTYHLR